MATACLTWAAWAAAWTCNARVKRKDHHAGSRAPGDVSRGKELGHFEIALKGPSL